MDVCGGGYAYMRIVRGRSLEWCSGGGRWRGRSKSLKAVL